MRIWTTSLIFFFTVSSRIIDTTDGAFKKSNNASHGSSYTNIDESSLVINGNLVDDQGPGSFRTHTVHGGFVQNESELVNGDMDRETFLSVFCRKD